MKINEIDVLSDNDFYYLCATIEYLEYFHYRKMDLYRNNIVVCHGHNHGKCIQRWLDGGAN